jgi:hypothetical protein
VRIGDELFFFLLLMNLAENFWFARLLPPVFVLFRVPAQPVARGT